MFADLHLHTNFSDGTYTPEELTAQAAKHQLAAIAHGDTHPGFERPIWRQMAEFGWLGILVPEQFGGLGLGCTEMAIVASGTAAALIPEPLTAAAVLAARTIGGVSGSNVTTVSIRLKNSGRKKSCAAAS